MGERLSPSAEQRNRLEPAEQEEIFSALAGRDHEAWRVGFRKKNPGKTENFKPIEGEDIAVDAEWIETNKRKPWYRHTAENGHEVDILALSFEELNPSRKREAGASINIALDQLSRGLEQDWPLDDTFVESTAALIHIKWMGRHYTRLRREIEAGESDTANEMAKAKAVKAKMQLLPYEDLPSGEKEYDRSAPRLVLREYRARHPELAGKIYVVGDEVLVSESKLTSIRAALHPAELRDMQGTVVSVLEDVGTKKSQALVTLKGIPGHFAVDFADLALISKEEPGA